jgi:cytochrome oxidase assembly protein ShyY1
VLRFLLAPKWLLFHALMAAMAVGCVVLGSWQFDTYRESDARHDLRAREAVELSTVASPGQPIGEAADSPVTFTGRYLASEQRRVPGRIHNGVLGSYVATPMLVADEGSDDDAVVFVLRGWVHAPDDPGTTPPDGTVTVTGHLLPPETSHDATVRSGVGVEAGEVAFLDPDELADATGIEPDAQILGYVVASSEDPKPAASLDVLNVNAVAPIRDVSPWQNLSYWAQWWVFAAAAVVFWFSAVRSAVRRRRTVDADPAPEPEPDADETATDLPKLSERA